MTIEQKLDQKGNVLNNPDLIEIGLFNSMTSLYSFTTEGKVPKSFKIGFQTAYYKEDVREFIRKTGKTIPTQGRRPYTRKLDNHGNIRRPLVKEQFAALNTEQKTIPEYIPRPDEPAAINSPMVVNLGNLLNQQFDGMRQSLETIKYEWRLDHDLLGQLRKDMSDLKEENKALNQRCTEIHDRVQHLENELGVSKPSILTRMTNKLRGLTQ